MTRVPAGSFRSTKSSPDPRMRGAEFFSRWTTQFARNFSVLSGAPRGVSAWRSPRPSWAPNWAKVPPPGLRAVPIGLSFALIQIDDGPAVFLGHLFQAPVGIGGDGMADGLQHGQVGIAVRVGPRLAQ